MTTAQLNAAARLLGTQDRELVFAACIKTLVESGVEVRDAIDAVLGAGRFDHIASSTYDALAN